VIRITPSEIHINDPEFYDTLYERAARRDRYSYFAGRFGYASDIFSTTHHDLHRMRRKPLNPMFSAKRISQFQPVIREKVTRLCERLAEYQKDGRILPLHLALIATSVDIITDYAFGRAYNHLDSPNFEDSKTLHHALTTIYVTGQLALHLPILFPILDLFPDWFTTKFQPVLQPVVGLRRVSSVIHRKVLGHIYLRCILH
jgi:cytochrome P450